jgi:hypothetical protein
MVKGMTQPMPPGVSSGWLGIPLSTYCARSTPTFPPSCCQENRSHQPPDTLTRGNKWDAPVVVLEVKGDRTEVVIDAGSTIRIYEIEATRNGRRVEITHGRGIVEVTEVTRGGTPVRTARFMASRVLALVEHPAARRATQEGKPTGQVVPQPRAGNNPIVRQPAKAI